MNKDTVFIMAVGFLAALGLDGCKQLKCGSGTTEVNGECVVQAKSRTATEKPSREEATEGPSPCESLKLSKEQEKVLTVDTVTAGVSTVRAGVRGCIVVLKVKASINRDYYFHWVFHDSSGVKLGESLEILQKLKIDDKVRISFTYPEDTAKITSQSR